MEDSSVSLRCSANIYCPFNPPTLTWSSSSNTLIPNDQQHQDQTKLISDLNFNITHLHHGVNFTCTIKYQLKDQIKTEQASRTLHVQYSPKNTSVTVNPSGSVLEGRSVTLTCISDGNPDVSYSWYRDTEEHLKHLQTEQNLTINKTDPTHSGRYYCRAQNQYGTQNSSVLLDIQYAPKNTSVTVNPSGSVLEGRSVTLTCISDGNPDVSYSWYRDTEEHLKHLQTEQNLTISKTDPTHSGRYYCTAQNQYGEQNSSSVILNVTYAPKISTSSCRRSDVIVCVCEVHGNPSPTLEWRLSGRPIINSTEMLISEEEFKNKSLWSILTIRQSLKDTPTPQCVSTNTHGTASQQVHLLLTPQDPRGFHHPSLLVGVAIGASVVMIFCIILFCIRRQKFKPSQTRQEDNTGPILTPRAVVQDDEGEIVYGNQVMMSHGGDVTQESLHYSSIDFTNTEPASGEIIGFSSLTTEYGVIQHHSAGASEAENNISTPVMDPKKHQVDKNAKITDVSSQASEDPTYDNITHR
ncbi:neural cell adhesion molecule 1-like [Xyrauchen texanus]|uniref:neural cell adhesion molecule 1-like n=1 Tax=Xyrauchen texanus TaxID=154827 RepID=UPI002241ABD8|nr:neural cell adhesion molecule 1-like [Xyrauchen texanus]